MQGPSGSGVTSPVLIGRDAEASRIDRALSALAEGHGRVVVISGEAGIGKTRLIEEALTRSDERVRSLRCECLALGSSIPYLPFAELLRDLARQVPGPDLARIVGPARTELARFLPEVAAIVATRDQAAGADHGRGDEIERLRLYEAFLRVAERIAAERPTAFVIEDVQWIDRASLELLAFLAHGLTSSGHAALIVSVRPEEAEDKEPVLRLLAELGRSNTAERIELQPLSPESIRRLASTILGRQPDAAAGERIWSLSDGNPLFAEELLASWQRRGPSEALPPKLRDLLAARLAQVPADVLAVLRVAAAAGRSVDDRLLTRASGLDEGQVQRAVRSAAEDYILIRSDGPAGPGYRFHHEILRALVASQLLPGEARDIHAAYARALEEERPEHRSATEIASHWDAAGETARALSAHLVAAQAAVASFAFIEAHAHLERALVLWVDASDPESETGTSSEALLGQAASAAARAGAFPRAIELTRTLLARGHVLDPDARELARSSLRWYLWESGDLPGALAEAEAALAEPGGLPHHWRANALGHAAALLLYLQRTDEARVRALEALEAARIAGALEEQILAEGVLGWCLLLEGDPDAGVAAIRSTLAAARRVDDGALRGRYPVGSVLAYSHLAAALELVGRLDEAQAVAIEGAAAAAQQGVTRTFGSVLKASAARALYQLGRWDEAGSTIEDALGAGAVGAGRLLLLAVRGLLAVGRGQVAEAEVVLAEADALEDAATPLDAQRWLAAATAEAAIWRGEPEAALARLAFVVADPAAHVITTPGSRPTMLDASIPHLLALGARAWADVALAERAGGVEDGLAERAETQLLSSLRRAEKRRALAHAWAGDLAIVRAELERGHAADVATRVRRWATAVERTRDRPSMQAYARWRLAEATLARRSQRDTAAETIAAALATTRSLGALPLQQELLALAQRARIPLAEDGRAAEPDSDARPFGLTLREAEVLALVASGLSNQDIAERLFISPKTASVHVSNIYAKLGVESRVAAATVAHSLGLDALPDEGESRSTAS